MTNPVKIDAERQYHADQFLRQLIAEAEKSLYEGRSCQGEGYNLHPRYGEATRGGVEIEDWEHPDYWGGYTPIILSATNLLQNNCCYEELTKLYPIAWHAISRFKTETVFQSGSDTAGVFIRTGLYKLNTPEPKMNPQTQTAPQRIK